MNINCSMCDGKGHLLSKEDECPLCVGAGSSGDLKYWMKVEQDWDEAELEQD